MAKKKSKLPMSKTSTNVSENPLNRRLRQDDEWIIDEDLERRIREEQEENERIDSMYERRHTDG